MRSTEITRLQRPEVYVAIVLYLTKTVVTPKWDFIVGRNIDFEEMDLFPNTVVSFRGQGIGYRVNSMAWTLEDFLIWTIAQQNSSSLSSFKFETSRGTTTIGTATIAAPRAGLDLSEDSARRRNLSGGSINTTVNGIVNTNSSLSVSLSIPAEVELEVVSVRKGAIEYTAEAVMTTVKDMLLILGRNDKNDRETSIDDSGFSLWNPYDGDTDGFTIEILPAGPQLTNRLAIGTLGEAVKWMWATRPVGRFMEFQGNIIYPLGPFRRKYGSFSLHRGKGRQSVRSL